LPSKPSRLVPGSDVSFCQRNYFKELSTQPPLKLKKATS